LVALYPMAWFGAHPSTGLEDPQHLIDQRPQRERRRRPDGRLGSPSDVVAEERQREVVCAPGGAVDEPSLDEAANEKVESRDLGQGRMQPAERDASFDSRHGFQHPLLGRARALEAILEEGQVKLVQQRRLDGSIGIERDVRRRNAPADVGAEELQKVGVARRPLDDLADDR
jgi:hypothetical protein